MDKKEIRAVHIQGMNTKEIHDDMVKTLCEESSSYSTVKRWIADFKKAMRALMMLHSQVAQNL